MQAKCNNSVEKEEVFAKLCKNAFLRGIRKISGKQACACIPHTSLGDLVEEAAFAFFGDYSQMTSS